MFAYLAQQQELYTGDVILNRVSIAVNSTWFYISCCTNNQLDLESCR